MPSRSEPPRPPSRSGSPTLDFRNPPLDP
jgi:hypothetical protein